ncbi:hypothetical protein [Dyella sp. 20L07]|uniref:hypothetical protein n=1 Tax=Dyella sp. 20L07 TaxID=3384240 RepID=UPI003D26FCED
MEQELERLAAHNRPDPRYIEKDSWNGFDIEVEYDSRHIYGPQFKIVWIQIDKPGKFCDLKKTTIEPLLEKGIDISTALRYVLQNVRATVEALNSTP